MSQDESPPNNGVKKPEDRPATEGSGQSLVTRLKGLLAGIIKSRIRLAVAAGSLIILLAAGAGAVMWVLNRGPTEGRQAEMIFAALQRGDYPLVHQLAEKVLKGKDVRPDAVQAALSAQLLAYASEADLTKGKGKQRLLNLAVSYGEQAAIVGFYPGWEEEGAFFLGRSLHYSARFAESRKYLREALKRTVNKQARVYWLLAESHLLDSQGDKAEALEFNEAFLQLPGLNVPSRNSGWMQRARIEIALGNLAEAEAALTKLSPQAAKSAEAQFLKSWIDYECGKKGLTSQETDKGQLAKDKLLSAQQKLDEIRRLPQAEESLRSKATYLLGMVFESLGEYNNAIATWQRCQTEYPSSYEAWAAQLRIAQLHHAMTQYDLASQELVAALRSVNDPTRFFNPWTSWAETKEFARNAIKTYKEKKLYSQALEVVNSLENSFPRGEVYELRAGVFSAWGESLLQATRDDSADTLADKTNAKRYLRLAGDEFTRLARSRVGTRLYVEDLWKAADHYYRGGSYSRASRVLREYLRNEARRRNSLALLRLGECLLAMGRVDESLLVFHECVEFHRKDAASYCARLLAAHAYLEKGLPDKAEEMLLANLSGELAPTSIEWRDSLFALAEMYYQMRRDQDAIPKLEEFIRRYPEEPRSVKAKYYLGEIYARIAWNQMTSTYDRRDDMRNLIAGRETLSRALEYYRQVRTDLDAQWEAKEPTEETRKILRNTYFGIGWACYHLGQFNDAMAAYTTVTNRFQAEPEVLQAYLEIARCRQAMGQTAQARIALEQARIVLSRLPNEITFEQTTPFSRAEWTNRLNKLLQRTSLEQTSALPVQ
ncbi:MAG: tetratricopeptide repeat protein [Thermogutta sp.]